MESRNDPTYREFFETKRAAGVEPLLRTSLPGVPPAHDIQGGGKGHGAQGEPATNPRVPVFTKHPATPPESAWPSLIAANVFGAHFFRCFFCRIGDNRIEDHFCEEGRELIVAMLDELHDREMA